MVSTSDLHDAQSQWEQRFNCGICLSPKLRMVYGVCQHKICDQCLYSVNGLRRQGMEKCPVCQKLDSFPLHRPDIPEDNIEIQKKLGITKCFQEGCNEELWMWELSEHLKDCHRKAKLSSKCKFSSSRKHGQRKMHSQIELQSLGPVVRRDRRQVRSRPALMQSQSRLHNRLQFRRNAQFCKTYTHCFT